MENFVAIENHSQEELNQILESAAAFKNAPYSEILKNKSLITMFFNPSTRTKTSFDLAITQLGGHCVNIEPGKSSWGIEIEEGAVMDGEAEEHLKDAVKVLNRYGDALALRCFPQFKNWQEEKKDLILANMVKWSDKPVINMETISHPCQALAMMQLIKEKLGSPKKKKMVLTWAYHPKPLNTAVANSAGMISSIFGMDLVIANPLGYDLDKGYIEQMKLNCKQTGGSFTQSHDMEDAFTDADFVYAKSWGSLEQYGNFQPDIHHQNKHWIVDEQKMKLTNNAYFSHCLPLRRNMLVTDGVLDSAQSLIYDEAENRLHVQKAVLKALMK
ncbi:MAG: N-acetylornithine carbamoyltransferase [Spirochaetes bacterium]|nr:N-acetylornithine carbamoyltransferase [Spirochaetota bacterium]